MNILTFDITTYLLYVRSIEFKKNIEAFTIMNVFEIFLI
jgi:hypothetical protein